LLFIGSLFFCYYNFLINYYNFFIFVIFLLIIFETIFLFLLNIFNKKSIKTLNLEIILTFSSFLIIIFCYLTTIKIIFNLEIYNEVNNKININIFGYQ
jgi:hypothetical protein